jgi:hypothetical protein
LKAGILHSEVVVVVSTESQYQVDDESLYDSSNIFAIQNIYRYWIYLFIFFYSVVFIIPKHFRLFPRVKIISELRKATNIRFMKFRAKDVRFFLNFFHFFHQKPLFLDGER